MIQVSSLLSLMESVQQSALKHGQRMSNTKWSRCFITEQNE